MKKLLYFAYGSNLLSDRLRHRIGSTTLLEKHYRLRDYKLTFDCGGFANIQPEKGSYVEGSLYTITPEQIMELNTYEGFYNTHFFTYKEYIVVVYIGKEYVVRRTKFLDEFPRHEYIDIILAGYLEKGLTTAYKKLADYKATLPKPFLRIKTLKRKKSARRLV